MPGVGFQTEGPLAESPGTIFDYEGSLGESTNAAFGRAIDTNPATQGILLARYQWEGKYGQLVSAEDARREVSSRGLDLQIPETGISRYELDAMQYLKQREIQQNSALARRSGPLTSIATFGAGLAGSVTDPINLGASFIPVVGEARYAAWLARAEGAGGRAAVRFGVGAAQGAIGTAAVEPLVYFGAKENQLDYGLGDAFLNVAFGGLIGGGLHSIGGAIYDARVSRALRSLDPGLRSLELDFRDAAARAPEPVHLDALHQATEALQNGEPVRATEVFAQHQQQAEQADAKTTPSDIVGFTTAKGSTYTLHDDATTTRDKAFRPEHGEAEQGIQPRSDQTLYVTPDDARRLATPEGKWRMFVHDDGSISLLTRNVNGDWGVSPSSRRVPTQSQPAVGLQPIELWNADASVTGPPGKAYAKVHFGNDITDLHSRTDASQSPRPSQAALAAEPDPVAKQASAEADARAASANTPTADLEAVTADTAAIDSAINRLKAREMWTAADDKAIEEADTKSAALETAAKLYRAAAVCMSE